MAHSTQRWNMNRGKFSCKTFKDVTKCSLGISFTRGVTPGWIDGCCHGVAMGLYDGKSVDLSFPALYSVSRRHLPSRSVLGELREVSVEVGRTR